MIGPTAAEKKLLAKYRHADKRPRKPVHKTEPEFRAEETKVTVEDAPKAMDSSEDVAMLRELRD